MKIKNWVGLLVVYVSYLCLGGFSFSKLECPNSIQLRREEWQRKKDMFQELRDFMQNLTDFQTAEFHAILDNYIDFSNVTEFDDRCIKWNFYNSLFFSFTAVTTIGYGHQAPSTNDGRTFCVFYSLLGIPLNAILIGAMGNLFCQKMNQLKSKAMSAEVRGISGMGKMSKVILEGLVFFLVLTLVFLFIPAAVFSSTEEKSWEYVDSVYYAFITLSTIGFGDMVAGRNEDTEVMKNGASKVMYQVGIIVWIILGLGYIVGVVNVLVQAMQSTSKPMKRVFRGIRNQIQIQDYWKRILTELIHIKQSEGWIQDDLLEDGAGGGSEPNLGLLDVPGSHDKRRALSTGDLDKPDEDNHAKPHHQHPDSRQHSLQELDKQSQMLADIEELNEDTITSLRHFLTTKMVGAGGISTPAPTTTSTDFASWLANNVPDSGMSLPPTRPVTRHNSASYHHQTVHPGPHRGQRWQSVHNPQRIRRRSIVSRQASVSSQNSLPAVPATVNLLEQTSLAEFLTAVEKVRARSEAELQAATLAVEEQQRKKSASSILRKLSMRMSGQPIDKVEPALERQDAPMTLTQVADLIQARGEEARNQVNNIPLHREGSGRSIGSTSTEPTLLEAAPSPWRTQSTPTHLLVPGQPPAPEVNTDRVVVQVVPESEIHQQKNNLM